MVKETIDVLMLILLNQVVHVFGKLTVLRASPNYYDNRKVICASEDDGGALMWNYVHDLEVYASLTNQFHDTCTFSNNTIDCEMNNDKGCLERWDRENWKLTNSMDTPMGPVLDRRWEAFEEYSLKEYYISLNNMSTIVIPFSVFARSNLNILICKSKNRTDLCYWVVIGGSENSRSVIRRCPAGVRQIEKYSQNNSECTENVYINDLQSIDVLYSTMHYLCMNELYLLPSTLYNISIQTMTINNETGNTNSLKFQTSTSVGLDGELGIWTKKSDSVIVLHIPKVLNDTRDSVTYIIVINPDICEQNIDLPTNLLNHIDEDKLKRIWQVVERPTDELVNKVFTMSDNYSEKCSLKSGELYEIVIVITEIKSLNGSVIFKYNKSFYFGGPPPTYNKVWFIGVILLFAAVSAAFYFHKK